MWLPDKCRPPCETLVERPASRGGCACGAPGAPLVSNLTAIPVFARSRAPSRAETKGEGMSSGLLILAATLFLVVAPWRGARWGALVGGLLGGTIALVGPSVPGDLRSRLLLSLGAVPALALLGAVFGVLAGALFEGGTPAVLARAPPDLDAVVRERFAAGRLPCEVGGGPADGLKRGGEVCEGGEGAPAVAPRRVVNLACRAAPSARASRTVGPSGWNGGSPRDCTVPSPRVGSTSWSSCGGPGPARGPGLCGDGLLGACPATS